MSWMEAPEGLHKLRVQLPNHPLVEGETLWAEHRSGDLYEIRNIPFHAYGLNFRDIVEAVAPEDGGFPVVRRVHRHNGHRTLRICFTEETLLEERIPTLMMLRPHGGTFEGASAAYFAIDVEPDGDYYAIFNQLREWHAHHLLAFETCESLEPHSFDRSLSRSPGLSAEPDETGAS